LSANCRVLLNAGQPCSSRPNTRISAIIDCGDEHLIRLGHSTVLDGMDAVYPAQTMLPRCQWESFGPVIAKPCDFLGKDRKLALPKGDLLQCARPCLRPLFMSSNYQTPAHARRKSCSMASKPILARRRKPSGEIFDLANPVTRGLIMCLHSPNAWAGQWTSWSLIW